MLRSHQANIRSTLIRTMMAAIVLSAVVIGRAQGDVGGPPTPEAAAEELVTLTASLTPFTMSYDLKAKVLTYREVVESGDKSLNNRIGELQVRLDRLDPTKMNYQTLTDAGTVYIRSQEIVGQMFFYCRAKERCLRRGFPDEQNGTLTSDESEEEGYTLDVVADHVINDMLRSAGLLQVLIAAAVAK